MHADGSALLQSFVDILQSRADMYPLNPVLCKLCLKLTDSQEANGSVTGVLLTMPAEALPEHALKKP